MTMPTLVCLPGWGFDARCFGPLIEALQPHLPAMDMVTMDLPGFGSAAGYESEQAWLGARLLDDLYRRLPDNCVLLGWSLGGMLATALAARSGQSKICGLVTIGSNPCFTARAGWPCAMPQQTFEEFIASHTASPQKNWQSFCGLSALGDSERRPLLKTLRALAPAEIGPDWGWALQRLALQDNRQFLQSLPARQLHLFGEADALVPVAAAQQIAQLVGEDSVSVVPGCGHAPHLSQPPAVAGQIKDFIRALPGAHTPNTIASNTGAPSTDAPFSKSAVGRSFGRAAETYDDAAGLQRAVCDRLLDRCDPAWQPRRILDLGSGTGYGSERLRERYPQAEIIAADIAEGMLRFARDQRDHADRYVAADAEALPFADNSFDLVFSSMALQWCYQLEKLFGEIRRVLGPDGFVQVSTLGPDTLKEVRASWAQVDDRTHVNKFLPEDAWLGAAANSGLPVQTLSESRRLPFATVKAALNSLKAVGAHNINQGCRTGLTGRQHIRRFRAAYESHRLPGGELPLTYQIIYLSA
ncbi:malonyl-ACP O-methyltransferase BioC [Biformimicrobium ophioploci]|uniref:Malonyl-[acyl-carrier protein] O-methyltransferase n=1 Tax=Biformimicrobium ophioploci TaxID=3036711 RepID=A0ABQ6LUM9_9GAMM|nr:malonyl-ACP O-methyltransferase BioC [Microbulbifer sp. NKW57]GMG85783.1 hypothetical protein MNKW57_01040 [Microbulbifer sp. NKW57]